MGSTAPLHEKSRKVRRVRFPLNLVKMVKHSEISWKIEEFTIIQLFTEKYLNTYDKLCVSLRFAAWGDLPLISTKI